MKLEDAKDKLEEARLFLRHLDAAQNEQTAQPPIPFRYCLSAFLNATYGVRQYLKAEFVLVRLEQAQRQGRPLPEEAEDAEARLYYQEVDKWVDTLLHDEQMLWRSMREFRNEESHEKRVPTVPRQKAVPLRSASRPQYGTVEISNAFAAQYMMYQQVAASYPEMAERLAKHGPPFGTGAWSYITEHHLEVGKALQSTVTACGGYVVLLNSLISHFEQSAP